MDGKKLIIDTVSILDRYVKLYKEISKGKFEDYESYFANEFSDEDELIKPKLWVDFLEKILDFPKDEYIPERPGITGKTPDCVPRDRRLHPFVFEIKGTDSRDLSSHYSQISDYIKPPIKWGVITNMRELITFENVSTFANQSIVPDYSFSFLQLYKDYKNHPKQILDFPNTKRFLDFVNRFKFQRIDFTKKLEIIKSAEKWTGSEELNPDELIDTIRKVTKLLVKDAQQYKKEFCANLQFDIGRRVNLGVELESIACELDKKRIVTQDVNAWKKITDSQPQTLESRVFDAYLSRVAYFAVTRILLVRMWEDVGFIDQSLYDGGFANLYETLNRQIQRVLRLAFNIAGERYNWLYNSENNYSWYSPSENILIDVLYEFSNYNLSRLDTDILGTVYEEYVDRTDRKNRGQYYTPREIIKLIWDRVGFTSDEQFFNYENGKRKPKLIFDPATGSGGFLVEAANRIRKSHYNDKDFNDLLEIFFSIVMGLYGSEISVFAHYITEINILIQLTPVIKKMLEAQGAEHLQAPRGFTLSTIPWNSLELEHFHWNNFMNNGDTEGEPILVPFDQQKKRVYKEIKNCHEFDYVCANPPYVGEEKHRELFQYTTFKFPYWKQYYQGKMDYLYFFIILGLRKLKEGGKLGFITTSYWPMADGANNLRQYILDNALIKEIIDLGETKIFEGAPGQHNIVFVLEKCSSYSNSKGKQLIKENVAHKENNNIKIVKVKKQLASVPDKSRLTPLIEYIEEHIDKKEYSDEYVDVFYSAVKQGQLTEKAWRGLTYRSNIDFNKYKCFPLGILCEIDTGIDTAANIVTESKTKLLPSDTSVKAGEGIFLLSKEEYQTLKENLTAKEQDRIKKLIGASDMGNHIIEPSESIRYLIYLTDKDNPEEYPNLINYLSKYRTILETRAEFKRNSSRKWYALAWSRPNIRFELPKIITPSRSVSNNFIIDTDSYYSLSGIFFIDKKDEVKESLSYIFALLNSVVLTSFCRINFKALGKSREYIKNSLEIIPIRRIDFKKSKEVKIHDDIVENVDSIISAKKELTEYNKFFKGVRLTKLDGPENIPEPDAYAITRSLLSGEQRILRTHPDIKIEPKELKEFYLTTIGKTEVSAPLFKKPGKEQLYFLELNGKNREKASIIAVLPIINYLKEILGNYAGKSMDEIKEMLIAKDLEVYEDKRKEIIKKVTSLLTKIKNIQKQIDDIVYELYGITDKERKIIEAL